MNPFESARRAAAEARRELASKGVDFSLNGFALMEAVCRALDITLKQVAASDLRLKGGDATIHVLRKWILVRRDVDDDVKAFLIAHEVGHLKLHAKAVGTIEVSAASLSSEADTQGLREVESYGAREREELRANVFARDFLLPRRTACELFLAGQSLSTLAADKQLPVELVRLQLYDGLLLPEPDHAPPATRLPAEPTPAQAPAVNSDAPVSMVEAGPGTGKTTALLLRLRRLLGAGVAPESVVILTFSNKAARELVERARASGVEGADRVWIGTFHAFGLEFLRKFGRLVDLESRFPVLDKLASLATLEADLPSLELRAFDPLSNPTPWLEDAVDTIRRAKDELADAAVFRQAVVAAPSSDPMRQARRQDVAAIFERYELLLSRRKALDLADLLCVATRLLQADDENVVHFRRGIRHVMVDEYQDVNRASALLVKAIRPENGSLWVVGDANQAIYAFMGASSSNLANFQRDFAGAVAIPLALNHRSSQEVVDLFSHVAAVNPAGRPAIRLVAEKGPGGPSPREVVTRDVDEEASALAWRIRDLEQQGVRLGQQAIIVFKNSYAAGLAQVLERQGIPILYLGNIFDRPEVKDLICLLQLSCDPYGINLVRFWRSPLLALSRTGADAVFAETAASGRWTEATGASLSAADRAAFETLKHLCSLVEADMSPWDALSKLLLEDGSLLRAACLDDSQAATNARMALWQFVHFCRTSDGTGRWSTVRNLPQRLRDRIRLGEDRSLRLVPPEAEGLDAVRVLTAHGSKGLEFDAVHFLDVKASIYEPANGSANPLLPESLLPSGDAADVLRNERHNLLYVAISRPRMHLTVFRREHDALPTSLRGRLEPLVEEWIRSAPSIGTLQTADATERTVEVQEYLGYVRCPQRQEMTGRAGRSQRDELKLHRAVDLAAHRAVRRMMEDPTLRADDRWVELVDEAIAHFGLNEPGRPATIRDKVEVIARRGRDWLSEGGVHDFELPMTMGPLKIQVKPDQSIHTDTEVKLRFIRMRASSVDAMKQPLAALADAHHASGGQRVSIEIATLSDGAITPAGTIRPATRPKYLALAQALRDEKFPVQPRTERECIYCPYMFPCSKQAGD